MAESDSDVEFQSADEGEEEEVIKKSDKSNQKQINVATKENENAEITDLKSEETEKTSNLNLNVNFEDDITDKSIEIDENKVDESKVDNDMQNNCASENVDEDFRTKCKTQPTSTQLSLTTEEQSTEENISENESKVDDVSDPPGEQVIGRQVENSPPDSDPAGGDAQRPNLQNPLDRLSEKSAKSSGGWGWGGWGKSIISSATNTVSGLGHGLSSAIQSVESSLGVPQPEDIAQEETEETQSKEHNKNKSSTNDQEEVETNEGGIDKDEEKVEEANAIEVEAATEATEETSSSGYSLFSYGASALSGVVGKTVSGGLGALELIGKKTMDVIQDGDPGLRKKRYYFTKSTGPTLSQTLKEAAEVAGQAALKEVEDEERNRAHFGILFDKYQGLAHLEALEILSNQSEGKVHSVMSTVTGDQLDNLKTQMIEIKDAFELQDMDVEEEDYETDKFVDTITEHLFTLSVAATPDKLKRVQREAHDWLGRCKQELEAKKETKLKEKEKKEIESNEEENKEDKIEDLADNSKEDNTSSDDKKDEDKTVLEEGGDVKDKDISKDDDKETEESEETIKLKEYLVPKEVHVKTIQTLAELTSRCIEQFHKAAELMLLQQAIEHSKNPIQRAASLSKLTSVLCCEVSSLTSHFCEQLTIAADIMEVKEEDVNPLITNSYLEGSNSMSYIQDAFQLLLPVLQVVAIEHEQ
ncbi:protein FAM114A2-like [Antedon mediterranea]|uniref:protein FAM114A2-like n=1 Tax=Antedon mediterranea TaxID=105859 RepID=UPI003AF9C8DE